MNTQRILISEIQHRIIRFFGPTLAIALTTAAAALSQSSPAPVNLGTAGDFAILAKTGISTTGTTTVVGDIGVSPAAATYITGFGLIMDASGTFSTSSLVTGSVFAAHYTDPTPTKMTTAVGDMETAYTNAAGRSSPDFSELYTGNITGKTLTRGLYMWSTGVLISAAGVTISGTSTDVWIFQIAQNLEVANGAIVTLSGGARAANIFWQVAGQVTLGTTASMKGILLCKTAIAMSTGATLQGRALAQSATTLDANAVTRPAAATYVKNSPASVPRDQARLWTSSNTSLGFTVPTSGIATLRIWNSLGQEVALLFNGDVEAGKYVQVLLSTGRITKGLYFLKLEFNGTVILKKFLSV